MRKLLLIFLTSFQLTQAGKPFIDFHQSQIAAQELISAMSSGQKFKTSYWDALLTQITTWDVHVAFHFKTHTLTACPLAAACLYGYTHAVEQILEDGADPNFPDPNGNTPLHLLLDKGEQEEPENPRSALFKLLRHPKIKIETRNEFGMTPIMMAAWAGKERDFFRLRTAGADVHAVTPQGVAVKDFAELTGILASDFFRVIFETDLPGRLSASPPALAPSEAERIEAELANIGFDEEIPDEVFEARKTPYPFQADAGYGTFDSKN